MSLNTFSRSKCKLGMVLTSSSIFYILTKKNKTHTITCFALGVHLFYYLNSYWSTILTFSREASTLWFFYYRVVPRRDNSLTIASLFSRHHRKARRNNICITFIGRYVLTFELIKNVFANPLFERPQYCFFFNCLEMVLYDSLI